MSFCTKCGEKNSEGSKFCIKCGQALGPPPAQPNQPVQPSPPVAPSPPAVQGPPASGQEHSRHTDILKYLKIIMGIYGVSGILLILVQNWFGMIICVALTGVLYYYGLAKAQAYEYGAVKQTCFGIGIAAGVFILIALAVREPVAAIVHGVAAGFLFYIYSLLGKE